MDGGRKWWCEYSKDAAAPVFRLDTVTTKILKRDVFGSMLKSVNFLSSSFAAQILQMEFNHGDACLFPRPMPERRATSTDGIQPRRRRARSVSPAARRESVSCDRKRDKSELYVTLPRDVPRSEFERKVASTCSLTVIQRKRSGTVFGIDGDMSYDGVASMVESMKLGRSTLRARSVSLLVFSVCFLSTRGMAQQLNDLLSDIAVALCSAAVVEVAEEEEAAALEWLKEADSSDEKKEACQSAHCVVAEYAVCTDEKTGKLKRFMNMRVCILCAIVRQSEIVALIRRENADVDKDRVIQPFILKRKRGLGQEIAPSPSKWEGFKHPFRVFNKRDYHWSKNGLVVAAAAAVQKT